MSEIQETYDFLLGPRRIADAIWRILLCIFAVIWLGIDICKEIREEMEKEKKNEG